MKIMIMPGPYKESLNADEVAYNIKRGIRSVLPHAEVICIPVCDGGTGFTQRLVNATAGELVPTVATGPTEAPIRTFFGILGDGSTAVIESAAVAGLALVPTEQRDPSLTTTLGCGELILQAVETGHQHIIVGCGDSATCDGGMGMASALGIRFLDTTGNDVPPVGGHLHQIHDIDTSEMHVDASTIKLTVACNLNSVCCGPHGTVRRYAIQKGASEESLPLLEAGMEHYAALIKEQFGVNICQLPGGGGAGGLGAALHVFLGAQLRYSIDVVVELMRLDERIQDADLVITGEGQLDASTATGKVVYGIAKLAKKYDVPVAAVVGNIANGADLNHCTEVDAVESCVASPMKLEEAITDAPRLIRQASTRLAKKVSIGAHL